MMLYHLTSADHAISNIALQRIKIARFGDLNDPFELLAVELSDKEFRKAIRSWRQEFHDSKGLLCFSEGWRNPVLWSHYGDKHRGICLGFEIPEKYTIPVNYTTERVQVRFENNDPNQGLSFDFVNELLRTKYEHWVYEKEKRMFVSLDEGTIENGLYFYPFDGSLQLKEVIIGANCEIPIGRIEKLVKIAGSPINIIKARLGFTRFEVVEDQRYERKKKKIV